MPGEAAAYEPESAVSPAPVTISPSVNVPSRDYGPTLDPVREQKALHAVIALAWHWPASGTSAYRDGLPALSVWRERSGLLETTSNRTIRIDTRRSDEGLNRLRRI